MNNSIRRHRNERAIISSCAKSYFASNEPDKFYDATSLWCTKWLAPIIPIQNYASVIIFITIAVVIVITVAPTHTHTD